MNIDLPLTPHLEQFVRDQLTSGRYRTEKDVIQAALRLLADQASSRGIPGGHPDLGADDPMGRPPGPSARREPLSSAASENSSLRRSPRGILADLPSSIDPDEIKETREEMWAGFRHSQP